MAGWSLNDTQSICKKYVMLGWNLTNTKNLQNTLCLGGWSSRTKTQKPDETYVMPGWTLKHMQKIRYGWLELKQYNKHQNLLWLAGASTNNKRLC